MIYIVKRFSEEEEDKSGGGLSKTGMGMVATGIGLGVGGGLLQKSGKKQYLKSEAGKELKSAINAFEASGGRGAAGTATWNRLKGAVGGVGKSMMGGKGVEKNAAAGARKLVGGTGMRILGGGLAAAGLVKTIHDSKKTKQKKFSLWSLFGKKQEEEEEGLEDLVPGWFTKEVDRLNKSINSFNDRIRRKIGPESTVYSYVYLPTIFTDIEKEGEDKILIGNLDGDNPDDCYSVAFGTEISFILDRETQKIVARQDRREIPIKGPLDIKKVIKFPPISISHFDSMFGKGWEKDVEEEKLKPEEFVKFFNQELKKV